jgi:hypothetical protein
MVVLVPATRTEPVTVTWTATATNADGPPANGAFSIPFAGPDIKVLEAVLRSNAERR